MERVLKGRVAWIFGDNFGFEQVMEPHSIGEVSPEQLAKMILTKCQLGLPPKIIKGDMLVAGGNFGGLGMQRAFTALQGAGLSCIIAESFSRSAFRGATNAAYPCITCKGITKKVQQWDELEVNLGTGEIKNITTRETLKTEPLPQEAMNIIEAGGLLPYLRKRLAP